MIYKASMDTMAKVGTVAVTVLFAAIIYNLLQGVTDGNGPLYTITLIILGYFITYIYRPMGYTLTEKELVIKRPIGNVKIPRVSIAEVTPVRRGKIAWAIRTFGVGGVFGYYGSFYNFSIGRMTWYMTNLNNALLIKTSSGRKILISPDESESFQLALHKN